MKTLLKSVSILFFAFFTTMAFADGSYSVTILPASNAALSAATAPNGETNIVIINYTNETIYQTSPLAATIEPSQSSWTKHPTFDGLTPVRITNSKGAEIFNNKAVFHRSTISVRITNNQYDVSVQEHK